MPAPGNAPAKRGMGSLRDRGPVVAVVGRANVGKSTLVNRFLGKREAIEHPEPGVTRDPRGFPVDWGGQSFTVVDTGGWEPRARGIAAKVVAQAERAAASADVIVFVVDATTGATTDDLAVARTLRRATVPVILAANKVDSPKAEEEIHELERLGLGLPLPVSALHGRASGDLLDVIVSHVRDVQVDAAEQPGVEETSIAIVGRPNVGKSSLFNRLVGEDRTIVDEKPGTTRDAIDMVVEAEGSRFRFVDTAGIRKRVRTATGPEYYGLVRSLRAVDEADVAVIVIDASEGPTEQDQKIAQRVAEAGRAAIVVLNKWDLVDEEQRGFLERDVEDRLRFVAWAPVLRTSAKTGRGVDKLLPAIRKVRETWEQRVPTGKLNAWLGQVADRIPLSSRGTKPTRLKYATMARTRPPEVVVFSTGPVSDQAVRALERRLRDSFGFEGTPIRVVVRQRARRMPGGR
ncbi:MAG: ribosome biogenesis GTPase Der [Actinomycetota bacterium]